MDSATHLTHSEQMLWDRLAGLCPKLVTHIHVTPQTFRGQRWFVLRDDTSGKHVRINEDAFELVGRFNGQLTVATIVAYLNERGTALDQRAILQIISNLYNLGALRGLTLKTASQLIDEYHTRRSAARWQRLLNPLVIRLPLFDPDLLLKTITPRCSVLFSKGAVIVWCVVLCFGLFAIINNLPAIQAEFRSEVLKPQNLLMLGLLYPLLKGLHELAHGICIKHWDGEVHEMGITFLVFAPVPYIDASASTSFTSKYERIAVSFAGIAVELLCAAVAISLWAIMDYGLARDCAFAVFTIGALSTLLFNANPLLKFDGYYVLQDLLEIPNLYSRSLAYHRYLFKRYALGLERAESPQTAAGEAKWFLMFGLASQLYRLLLMLLIVVMLSSRFAVLGAVLGTWAVVQQVALPLYRGLVYLGKAPELSQIRRRSLIRVSVPVTLLLVTFLVLPLPHSTQVHGIVWVPDQGEVYADSAGFVHRVFIPPDGKVQAGQPLLELSNQDLSRDVITLEADLKVININIASESDRATNQLALLKSDRTVLEKQLAQLRQEQALLQIKARSDGVFALAGYDILVGRHFSKGDLIGHVVDSEQLIVLAAVPESRSGPLHQGVTGASIRLAENPLRTIAAQLQRQTPAANHTLPSAALGAWGGGGIEVASSDPEGLTTIEKVFHLQLSMSTESPVSGVGSRAYVRLQHSSAPLASRWMRELQQLFLEFLPS